MWICCTQFALGCHYSCHWRSFEHLCRMWLSVLLASIVTTCIPLRSKTESMWSWISFLLAVLRLSLCILGFGWKIGWIESWALGYMFLSVHWLRLDHQERTSSTITTRSWVHWSLAKVHFPVCLFWQKITQSEAYLNTKLCRQIIIFNTPLCRI